MTPKGMMIVRKQYT